MVCLFAHRNVLAFEDYLNRALRLALVSLDSTVLIFIFAGFNLLLFFFAFFCSFCCYLVCSLEMSLHLKIIFTGRYALPKFRWIQLSQFICSLDSRCGRFFFACFVVVMLPCLLLRNYKMLKCSTDFSVDRSEFLCI